VLRRLAPALLIALTLIPILAVRLPPLVDVLGHLGRYAIQTGLDDHPWLKQYFTFHWQVIGNLGADLLIELLAPFFDVETSVRVVVTLTQLLAASAIVLLCREVHGRITPFCLFALPLIYSFSFNYGFINFALSMALALLGFALWLWLTRTNRHRARSWLFVPIGLAIWLCHTFGWAFLGLLCAADSLVRSRRAGHGWPGTLSGTAGRCLPLAAPLLPMLVWRSHAGGLTTGWFRIPLKLNWLLSILHLDNVTLDRLSAAVLLGLIYFGLRSHRIARDATLLTAAALCLLAFLVLPLRLFGSFFADMRMAPYMAIVALLAFDDRPLAEGSRRGLMLAAITFLALRIGITTATYVERERDLNAHLQALDAIPEAARVATLVSLPCPSDWQLPVLGHLGSMAIARKHAFANDQWATGSMNLLSVHYPQAGEFAADSSEMIYPKRCGEDGPTMRQAVAALPEGAFTHLWIVGLPPREQPTREGLTLVWRGPDSAVYRIGSIQAPAASTSALPPRQR
jgi:hypothetical protein